MFNEAEHNRRSRVIRKSDTMHEAAEKLGLSYSSLAHWAKKYNIKPKIRHKRECDLVNDGERMALYNQGKTDKEIADATGVGINTIAKWRRRKKLERHKPRKIKQEEKPKPQQPKPQVKVKPPAVICKAKPKHFPPEIRQRLGFYQMIL